MKILTIAVAALVVFLAPWPVQARDDFISAVTWGADGYGQCDVPEPNTDFVAVTAGAYHNLALKSDGSIVGWGYDIQGCTIPPSPNTDFVAVAAGDAANSLGLKADGRIVGWGHNDYGQCNVPEPNVDFVAIAAGGAHCLGLKSDSSIVAWGYNAQGQCNVPEPNRGFVAVAAGGWHSLGLKASGSIVKWGSDGTFVPEPNTDFIAIAAGGAHSLGLKSDGSIVAWGYNGYGQCSVPEPNSGFVAIGAGASHSLGLKSDGRILAWGLNDQGQCDVPEPNRGFLALDGGFAHSLALTHYHSGACCLILYCLLASDSECASYGGSYQGNGILCDPNPCPTSSTELPDRVRSLHLETVPNPSAGPVLIVYQIPNASEVTIEILDVAGTLVRRFSEGHTTAGRHSTRWDGRNDEGRDLPAGVYLTKMTTAEGVTTGRAVLAK